MKISPFPRFRRMAFPQALVQLRRAKGMSQQALADATGIHVTQIKRHEGGSAQPSMDGLKKMAVALDCATDAPVVDASEPNLRVKPQTSGSENIFV